MIVGKLDNRTLGVKTELIDGGYHIIVSIKFSCCENIVSGVVKKYVERNIDIGTVITRDLCGEMSIHGDKSGLCVCIGFVKRIYANNALLRNIELLLTTCSE